MMPWNSQNTRSNIRPPTAATVCLAVGGFVALYYAVFAIVPALSASGACFGTLSCPKGAVSVLDIFWFLAFLVATTAAVALVGAFALHRKPARHTLVGWTTTVLSAASLVSVYLALPTAFWLLVVLFGGWAVFLIFIGGILALAWKNPTLAPIPPAVMV
jgi:hypothetical protein